jgi:CubicO group peptidase (beta-lactamase class C family)
MLMTFSRRELVLVFTSLFISSIAWGGISTSFQDEFNRWSERNNIAAAVVQFSSPHHSHFFKVGSASNETQFGVGSITKTFVSAMILRLEAKGKLDISDNLGKYLPQYSRWNKISIKQLLNMTSGISNYSEAQSHSETKGTTGLIEFAYQQADYFKPGQGWHYSNTNYLLLAEIIKRITGVKLANVFKAEFLVPFKLRHTTYKSFSADAPAAGMMMSASDLESWVNHLFIQADVIPQRQLSEMLTTVAVTNVSFYPANTGYGLGVLVSKDSKLGDKIWYTGVVPGYTATFLWMPKSNTLAIAEARHQTFQTNKNNFNMLFPNQDLFHIIDARLMEKSDR